MRRTTSVVGRLSLVRILVHVFSILALVAFLYTTDVGLGDIPRFVSFVASLYCTYVLVAPGVHRAFGHNWQGFGGVREGRVRIAMILVCAGTVLFLMSSRWEVSAGVLMAGACCAIASVTFDILRKSWQSRRG